MTSALDSATRSLLFPPAVAIGMRKPRRTAAAVLTAALDIVYPPHCCSCGAPLESGANRALCETCATKIKWIGADRCKRCGDSVGMGLGAIETCSTCRTYPPRFVEASAAAVNYAEGPVRDMILSIKFGRRVHVAQTLGEIIAHRIFATALALPGATLIPTPLTNSGFRERGFNQAGEIARVIAQRLKLRIESRLLKKIRATPAQATLSKEKRRENLVDAFACNPRIAKRYAGQPVIVIDDVITTGATISECARTLHAAGVGLIRAAAFARG